MQLLKPEVNTAEQVSLGPKASGLRGAVTLRRPDLKVLKATGSGPGALAPLTAKEDGPRVRAVLTAKAPGPKVQDKDGTDKGPGPVVLRPDLRERPVRDGAAAREPDLPAEQGPEQALCLKPRTGPEGLMLPEAAGTKGEKAARMPASPAKTSVPLRGATLPRRAGQTAAPVIKCPSTALPRRGR